MIRLMIYIKGSLREKKRKLLFSFGGLFHIYNRFLTVYNKLVLKCWDFQKIH